MLKFKLADILPEFIKTVISKHDRLLKEGIFPKEVYTVGDLDG